MSDEVTEAAEAPQVTGKETFARRGFKSAEQAIAEAEAAPAPAVEAQAESADAEITEIIQQEGVDYAGLTVTGGDDGQEAEAGEAEPQAAAAPAEEMKYRIGSKEFATQKEAFDYAQEIEQERIAADAFRQGVELAAATAQSNLPPQAAQPKEPEEIDPEFYTNPKSYFAKKEAELLRRASETVQQDLQRRQTHDATWNKFYSDYPDLAPAKDFVDLTLQKNWNTLQHVETNQALKQLADKVREQLKPIIDAKMPKVTLPQVKTAASPGGAEGVTAPKKETKTLSFVEQQKNLRRNRAQLR